jgi:hypothetical protein
MQACRCIHSINEACQCAGQCADILIRTPYLHLLSSTNAMFAACAGAMVTQIYNCSALNNPTYDVIEPATKLKVNAPPYCAELFNPR